MRKTSIFLLFLIAFNTPNALAFYPIEAQKEKLIISKTFPEEGVYFKAVPTIDVDEAGNIYAVGNREHMVFKFSPDGKLLLKFGGMGQGPGELQWPYYLSISKNLKLILVEDDIGVSFFSEDGIFIKRFRVFSPISSIYASPNKIYLLQPTENNLI